MTDQLRRLPDDLHALATRTAVARGLPAPYVEKDFWVTEILRVATDDRTVRMPDGSTAPVTFLFKGVTSLSRVFGMVERFSEDVGSRGGTHPHDSHPYRSLVADYATAELGESEDTWEEFAAFNVDVLAPERTLLEKVAAVHGAAVRGDTAALAKHARHFYDIERLLNTPFVTGALDALGPTGLADLVEDITSHSADAGFSWSPRPEGGYADSPAFDPDSDVHDAIRAGYEAAQSLIHGTRISLDEVTATVRANRTRL